MNTSDCRGQMRASDPLQLELVVNDGVNSLVWVLRIELCSFANSKASHL